MGPIWAHMAQKHKKPASLGGLERHKLYATFAWGIIISVFRKQAEVPWQEACWHSIPGQKLAEAMPTKALQIQAQLNSTSLDNINLKYFWIIFQNFNPIFRFRLYFKVFGLKTVFFGLLDAKPCRTIMKLITPKSHF